MRVYFLSCAPAVLKLNGLYAGSVDGFERHVELDPADRIFAEIVPGDNMQAVNFFLDEKFFSCPPPFVDLYLADGDAFVYVREYSAKDVKIEVVFQTRFNGNLITVFSQGGIYLSAEGAEYSLTPLPQAFKQLRAENRTLCGRDVLALYGGNMLAVISDLGKLIFLNAVESAEFGDELKTVTPFETCTAAKAQCTYSYDGEELTLIESVTAESRPPEADILHFAFFESILTCGNYADYLDASLKAKAGQLKSYLGKFVSVTVPPEKFYALHGEIAAAGLVYPKSRNLYEIKYYAVDVENAKITNVFPVE